MAKQPYLPTTDEERVVWIKNYAEKKDQYQALFGFTPTEVALTYNDYKMWKFLVNRAFKFEAEREEFYEYKEAVEEGPETYDTSNKPIFDPGDPFPTVVPPDIFGRIGDEAETIKRHDDYTTGIGGEMGIEGAAIVFNPQTYKTTMKAKAFEGFVNVRFVKKGVDAVVIYSRLQGQTTWVKLDRALQSPYKDIRPLAQAGMPEVREYSGKGFIGKEELPLRSDTVTITFSG